MECKMEILVDCECGQQLKAPAEFSGSQAQCPFCGRVVTVPAEDASIPDGIDPPLGSDACSPVEATEIPENLDPPKSPVEPREKRRISYRQMFEALLDPRSIQWMLTLGGGLAVLGLVVWLASVG